MCETKGCGMRSCCRRHCESNPQTSDGGEEGKETVSVMQGASAYAFVFCKLVPPRTGVGNGITVRKDVKLALQNGHWSFDDDRGRQNTGFLERTPSSQTCIQMCMCMQPGTVGGWVAYHFTTGRPVRGVLEMHRLIGEVEIKRERDRGRERERENGWMIDEFWNPVTTLHRPRRWCLLVKATGNSVARFPSLCQRVQESGVRRPVESESYFERLQIGRYGCCAFDGGTYICLFAIPFYSQSSAKRQSQIYRTGILATANIKQEKKKQSA